MTTTTDEETKPEVKVNKGSRHSQAMPTDSGKRRGSANMDLDTKDRRRKNGGETSKAEGKLRQRNGTSMYRNKSSSEEGDSEVEGAGRKTKNGKATKTEFRTGLTLMGMDEDDESIGETHDEDQENRAPAEDMTTKEGKNNDKKNKSNKGRSKKFTKSKNSPRQRIRGKSRENFVQTTLWRRLGILESKDKMMWARRAFFMSTERIFPGFTRNYGLSITHKARDPAGIKLRSSVPLKMCLLCHAYYLPLWFLGFLVTQQFSVRSLKPLHSYVHICITYISMGTDLLRLYAGFLSNTKDDMQLLALYWMATVILQAPMLCFIFATHSFSTKLLPLNVSLDILLASVLLLEIWFGFWHLKGLVSSEISLLHMARQMHDVVLETGGSGGDRKNPRVVNCPERGPYLDWSSSSDQESLSQSRFKFPSAKTGPKSQAAGGGGKRANQDVILKDSSTSEDTALEIS